MSRLRKGARPHSSSSSSVQLQQHAAAACCCSNSQLAARSMQQQSARSMQACSMRRFTLLHLSAAQGCVMRAGAHGVHHHQGRDRLGQQRVWAAGAWRPRARRVQPALRHQDAARRDGHAGATMQRLVVSCLWCLLCSSQRRQQQRQQRQRPPAVNTTLPDCGLCCRQVTCGRFHTICVTAQSQVYAWGHNSAGQLGLSDRRDR